MSILFFHLRVSIVDYLPLKIEIAQNRRIGILAECLRTIIIPTSVEILGKYSFYNCKSLASITFKSGSKLQRIEDSTVMESGLTSIIIPASVEVLGKSYFSTCELLLSVAFESGSKLQRIDEFAFMGSGLTAISIPASVEVLRRSCFSDCGPLSLVRFEPNSKLREVSTDSFVRSPNLDHVEFPPSAQEVLPEE
jgi:hypothetical protein